MTGARSLALNLAWKADETAWKRPGTGLCGRCVARCARQCSCLSGSSAAHPPTGNRTDSKLGMHILASN